MSPAERAQLEQRLTELLEPTGVWGVRALELVRTYAPSFSQAQLVFAMAWGTCEAARGMPRRDVYRLVLFALDTFTKHRDREVPPPTT